MPLKDITNAKRTRRSETQRKKKRISGKENANPTENDQKMKADSIVKDEFDLDPSDMELTDTEDTKIEVSKPPETMKSDTSNINEIVHDEIKLPTPKLNKTFERDVKWIPHGIWIKSEREMLQETDSDSDFWK